MTTQAKFLLLEPFTYPLSPGERMDYQFGFTDITTAVAADRIVFNSRTHQDAYFRALPKFINMMPEYRPTWVVDEIRAKAEVLYPGCRFGSEISAEESFDRPLRSIIGKFSGDFGFLTPMPPWIKCLPTGPPAIRS